MLPQAAQFLASALPWPVPGSWTDTPPWFVNIHWKSEIADDKGKRRIIFPGRACTSVDEAINQIEYRLTANGGTDIYVCMSGQSQAKEKIAKNGRKYWAAKRSLATSVLMKSIWIDVDVKEKGFGTTLEAAEAFSKWRAKVGLPLPSFVIMSGSGGFHVHWVMNEPITVERWWALSNHLVAAMQAEGFSPIDYGVTTDAARLLRIPQTFNHKHTPPKPVYMMAAP